jgi:hypothetical protein
MRSELNASGASCKSERKGCSSELLGSAEVKSKFFELVIRRVVGFGETIWSLNRRSRVRRKHSPLDLPY